MNELGNEKSPYLKQHAHNPVHWKAWGDAAFNLARNSRKPIFLSIGYSTCHWCHVMEKESFENQAIADFLNEHFVSIKIDREELPEVDAQYMHAVQIMTRHGGWPMSVFLDHELRPFYGGTYFPPKNFLSLLGKISELWTKDIGEIHRAAGEMHKVLQLREENAARPPAAELRENFYQISAQAFDTLQGGHLGAPKFPMNYEIICGLRLARTAAQRDEATKHSQLTLDKMLSGGIWDHVGGGIHRYSTDDEWRAPHFEKMLYDQASLLNALTENLAVAPNPFYESRARALIEYLRRDLKISGGAFYAAEDADSEGHEGTFYVWTYDELKKTLAPDEFSSLADHFEIAPGGNWEKKIILHASVPEKISFTEIWNKLLAIRAQRPRPLRDDKIITAWNGLMIGALSRFARVCGDAGAVRMAEEAAKFLRAHCCDGNNKLARRWIDGEAKFAAQLEDYAFLIEGLLELYAATSDAGYLNWAVDLQKTVDSEFYRRDSKFYVNNTRENLLRENQEWADNVTPSAISTNLLNLIWLSELTYDSQYTSRAEECLVTVNEGTVRHPIAYPRLIEAIDLIEDERETVAVVCENGISLEERLKIYRSLETLYRARRKILVGTEGDGPSHPLLKNKPVKYRPATYYVCRGKTCDEAAKTYS